jgi:N-acetylneuraminic acid mutarotase
MFRTIGTALCALLILPCAWAADTVDSPTWVAKGKGCSKRFAHGAVWDTKHDNMLLFGGEAHEGENFSFFNDLWTYDPTKDEWKELTLKEKTAPSKRAYHACTWDSKRHVLWSFGGAAADFSGLDDLWSFDPEKLTWTKIDQPKNGPKGRLSATLVYHPAKDSLILFGGLNGFGEKTVPVHDLWVYDIKDNKWSEKKCAAPQLWQCAAALDPKTGLFIMNGGFDEKFQVRTETWIYEVDNDKWRDPINGKRFTDAHTGVWDPTIGRMIAFGGANPEQGAKGHDDARTFDPAKDAWSTLEVKGDKPAGRAYHSAVWDPTSNSMIVFGGTANQFSDPPCENTVWILKMPTKK